MNGSIPADAREIAHRRSNSGTAEAAGAARNPAEFGGTAGEARVGSTPPLVSSHCTSGSGDSAQPHAALLETG